MHKFQMCIRDSMRSTYLDTELMLVIRSKEINKQLEEGMMEYELSLIHI